MKALADPLRYRVFENLIAEPRTARQMAQHLGTHPTRLYHHFRVLEKAGLIRAAGTRQKRGTVEKYFSAAVDRIEARGAQAGGDAALLSGVFEGVLGSTLADLQQAGASAGKRAVRQYVRRYRIRPTPEQAAEIRTRLEALARLCESAAAAGGGPEFGVTLAFYESPTTAKRRSRS
jgi:DNA-binding transcriptional ArsR family regulator